ncbi:hypothetical protein J6590_024511 [Homalodisca vitripennis]|nr:hypothetical protein J6590_024511 [Homalodisca vitripennis]
MCSAVSFRSSHILQSRSSLESADSVQMLPQKRRKDATLEIAPRSPCTDACYHKSGTNHPVCE